MQIKTKKLERKKSTFVCLCVFMNVEMRLKRDLQDLRGCMNTIWNRHLDSPFPSWNDFQLARHIFPLYFLILPCVLNLLLFKSKIYLPDIYETPRNSDFSCCLPKTEKLWYGHSSCYGIRLCYDVSLCFGQLQPVMERRIELLLKLKICHLFHQLITTFQNDNPPWCVLRPKRGEKFALPRNIIWWWRGGGKRGGVQVGVLL